MIDPVPVWYFGFLKMFKDVDMFELLFGLPADGHDTIVCHNGNDELHISSGTEA